MSLYPLLTEQLKTPMKVLKGMQTKVRVRMELLIHWLLRRHAFLPLEPVRHRHALERVLHLKTAQPHAAQMARRASVIERIEPMVLPAESFPFHDHASAGHELLGLCLGGQAYERSGS